MFLWVHAKCSLLYSCVWIGGWCDGWYFTIFMFRFYWFFYINVGLIVLTMLAASIHGFLLFWQPATSYSFSIVSLFCCLMALLFVANKVFFLLSWSCRHDVPVRPWTWTSLPGRRHSASREDSRLTTPAVIVDIGIGRSVYTTVHCRRPSVSRRRGTNMEQFASWTDVIKFPANLQNQTKISFSLGVVSIVSKLL